MLKQFDYGTQTVTATDGQTDGFQLVALTGGSIWIVRMCGVCRFNGIKVHSNLHMFAVTSDHHRQTDGQTVGQRYVISWLVLQN